MRGFMNVRNQLVGGKINIQLINNLKVCTRVSCAEVYL